jgi:cell division transport system permease protein
MLPYALREALASFRRAPLLIGLSAGMIALSLFVVGLFGIAAYNVGRVLERVEERVEIVAYLRDGARLNAIELARNEIAAYPEVLDVIYVSREQALDIARRELADLHELVAELDVNPLPASLEVRLRPGLRDERAVRDVADRIAAYPIVDEVLYGQDWLDKIFLLRRIAGAAAGVLGAAFAAVAALIIGAAVRMAIFARRDEIAIMRLVGATESFIQGPFLIEGMLTGLLGGLIALPALFLTHRQLSGSVFALEWLPDLWIVGGIAGGAVVGLAASALAVHRHLREV